MDIGPYEVNAFLQCYKEAAIGGDRSRFEAWLDDYAIQRCKISREGIVWDDSSKFPFIKSSLSDADQVAGMVPKLLEKERMMISNCYHQFDVDTVYQLVVLETESTHKFFILLKEGSDSEWRVLSIFAAETFHEQWSNSYEHAKNSFKKSSKGTPADDDYWAQYDAALEGNRSEDNEGAGEKDIGWWSDSEEGDDDSKAKDTEKKEDEYWAQYGDNSKAAHEPPHASIPQFSPELAELISERMNQIEREELELVKPPSDVTEDVRTSIAEEIKMSVKSLKAKATQAGMTSAKFNSTVLKALDLDLEL